MTFTPSISGVSTLTHYTLPSHYIASCGCVGSVTDYPTAAINRLAYDSDSSFGPRCGSCLRLTLQSTPLASGWDPIDFTENGRNSSQEAPSVVVKIVDACPVQGEWCNATQTQGNKLGYQIHFDLAWPSKGIPDDFFPGDHDYGVWTALYEYVSCTAWDGYTHEKALGSDWSQSNAACCPADPPLPPNPIRSSSSISTSQQSPSTPSNTILTSASDTASSSISSLNSSTLPPDSNTNSTSAFSLAGPASRASIPPTSSFSPSSTQAILKRRYQSPHHHKGSSHLTSRQLSILDNPAQFQQCPSYSDLVGTSNQGITADLNSLIPNTSNILSKNDDASNGALALNNLFSLFNWKSIHREGRNANANANGGGDEDQDQVFTIPRRLEKWILEKFNGQNLSNRSTGERWKFNWRKLRGTFWMRDSDLDLDFQKLESREVATQDKLDLEKTFGKPPLLKVAEEL